MKTLANFFILLFFIPVCYVSAQDSSTPKFTSDHSSVDKKTGIYSYIGNVQTEISHFLIENDSLEYNEFDEVITFYASKAHPIKIIDLNFEYVKPIYLDSTYKLDLLVNPDIVPVKEVIDINSLIPKYPITESDSSNLNYGKNNLALIGNVSITFEEFIIKSDHIDQDLSTNNLFIHGSKDSPITIQITNPNNILSSNSSSIVNKLSKKGEFIIKSNLLFKVKDNRLDLIQ
ncbi:hypothetical protein [Flammeovirga sp. OC4]|uniref:hypothetical protein n=1 Tax=Flammeovirga sp. OC4 TaxID=1382345 RepID=UPI0012E0223A|nr:hypothetical protein [Flammeovirga sp. OC4]